MVSTS